jgi:hypothetical protein
MITALQPNLAVHRHTAVRETTGPQLPKSSRGNARRHKKPETHAGPDGKKVAFTRAASPEMV